MEQYKSELRFCYSPQNLKYLYFYGTYETSNSIYIWGANAPQPQTLMWYFLIWLTTSNAYVLPCLFTPPASERLLPGSVGRNQLRYFTKFANILTKHKPCRYWLYRLSFILITSYQTFLIICYHCGIDTLTRFGSVYTLARSG